MPPVCASRRWLTRTFSAKVRGRPRRSRPMATRLARRSYTPLTSSMGVLAATAISDLPFCGVGPRRGPWRGRPERLAAPAHVDKYRTSARDPVPEHRGAAPPSPRVRRPRRLAAAPQRVRAVRRVFGQPGDGSPSARDPPGGGTGRLPAGLRVVRRHRPAAAEPGPAGHHRTPAGRRGGGVDPAGPRLPVRERPAPRPAGARVRLGAAGAPVEPGRRRALRPRHRVVPRGVRRRAEPGRRRAVTVLRTARRAPRWGYSDD